MYCTKIDIFGSQAYPLFAGAIYEKIAEHYRLPDIRLILKSLNETVDWPDRDYNRLEAYYLDNLIEENRRDLFQIRFSTAANSRELTSLFLSVEESQVKTISVQFPGRSGQMAGSHIIACIKSAIHVFHISPSSLEIEVQGFLEEGWAGYIKEHSLSAFVWVEPINRYLHVKENPHGTEFVRKGKARL